MKKASIVLVKNNDFANKSLANLPIDRQRKNAPFRALSKKSVEIYKRIDIAGMVKMLNNVPSNTQSAA